MSTDNKETTTTTTTTTITTTSIIHNSNNVWKKIRSFVPNLLFVIEKSLNGNVVAFEGIMEKHNETTTTHSSSLPFCENVQFYWLNEDEKQLTYTRSELSDIEILLAYGYRLNKESHPYVLTLNAYPHIPIYLGTTIHHNPIAFTTINGKKCRLESIFVHMSRNILIPDIRGVDVIGTDMATFERQIEHIKKT